MQRRIARNHNSLQCRPVGLTENLCEIHTMTKTSSGSLSIVQGGHATRSPLSPSPPKPTNEERCRNTSKTRKKEKKSGQQLTSLLPRPNPLITGPCNLMGNGDSGPLSGPANCSRSRSPPSLTVTLAGGCAPVVSGSVALDDILFDGYLQVVVVGN